MTTGVILANTGTPAGPEPDDVGAYLKQFLMDPRIIQVPRPLRSYIVNRHIVPKRKFASSKRYQVIWRQDGSPLVADQQALASKVQALFDAQGGDVDVQVGMSYGSPSVSEALARFLKKGHDKAVLLPLYPQSAFSPTQAVIDSFRRAVTQVGWDRPVHVIDNYHDNPLYVRGIADAVRRAGFGDKPGDRLMFSMHSILLKDRRAGDTYVEQTERSVGLIAQELGIEAGDIVVAYQSVFGHQPERWQGPLSLDVLAQMREQGFEGRLFFMCPGFAIDCLETLYDIPYEMCPALEGRGIHPEQAEHFHWIMCLGPSDEHARIIKDVLDRSMEG